MVILDNDSKLVTLLGVSLWGMLAVIIVGMMMVMFIF